MSTERREHQPIEETVMYRLFEGIGDECWNNVIHWKSFAQSTTGKQLVRAADSVCANLSEGGARYGHADSIHFLVISRGSAREARFWIRTSAIRSLLKQADATALVRKLDTAVKALNGFIGYRRTTNLAVKENPKPYSADLSEVHDGFEMDFDWVQAENCFWPDAHALLTKLTSAEAKTQDPRPKTEG